MKRFITRHRLSVGVQYSGFILGSYKFWRKKQDNRCKTINLEQTKSREDLGLSTESSKSNTSNTFLFFFSFCIFALGLTQVHRFMYTYRGIYCAWDSFDKCQLSPPGTLHLPIPASDFGVDGRVPSGMALPSRWWTLYSDYTASCEHDVRTSILAVYDRWIYHRCHTIYYCGLCNAQRNLQIADTLGRWNSEVFVIQNLKFAESLQFVLLFFVFIMFL